MPSEDGGASGLQAIVGPVVAVPYDVFKEGDATSVLLMRQAFLAKASLDGAYAVPAQVSDDTYGVRVGVVFP